MDNPDIFFGNANFDDVHQEQISSSCVTEGESEFSNNYNSQNNLNQILPNDQISTDVDNVNNTIFDGSINLNAPKSSDNSLPLVSPSQDGSGVLPTADSNSADYNVQNYANYNNYMYNYNGYYGYPYPQYQWDYNNQQYYQPYQNYYNLNSNSKQSQSSKQPPPPPKNDVVQLPVEEKPNNKINNATTDDSNL